MMDYKLWISFKKEVQNHLRLQVTAKKNLYSKEYLKVVVIADDPECVICGEVLSKESINSLKLFPQKVSGISFASSKMRFH